MTAYATVQDIIDAWSEEDLAIIAPNGSGGIDTQAVERALDRAAHRIDAALAKRYDLPISPTPLLLQDLSIDIAIYYVGRNVVGGTEERRKRFEDAKGDLKDVRDGKLFLGVHEASDGEQAVDNIDAEITSEERLFSRTSMKGLL